MNATKSIAMVIALTILAPSIGLAREALGTAKARRDYSSFQLQRRTNCLIVRPQTTYYRYSVPVVREVPSEAIAQAPAEGRRFSQAPAVESSNPLSEAATVTTQPSERRYSYAPDVQTGVRPVQRYSGKVGGNSQPLWALPKTDPRKHSAR
jgi:hypothetical protein